MPSIPYKAAVVKQLNRINGAALLPTDVVLGKFVPGTDPTIGTAALAAASTGTVPNAGRTTVQYHRVPLSSLFASAPKPLVIAPAPTLYELFLHLSQVTGVTLSADDVANQTLDFSSGTTTLTLTAKDTSSLCSGSVTLNLKAAEAVNLASAWSANKLTRTALLADISDLIALANTTNARYVEKQAVSWGSLRNSDSSLGNSVVTFTGKEAYGYTGSVDLYFDRDTIAALFPDLYTYSTQAYTGTTRSFVQTYFPKVLDQVLLDNIVDNPVSYGSTGQDVDVPISVVETSLNLTGTVQAHIYWQSGTDYVSLRSAFTQYATKDLTAASVTNITGKTLMRQFYPVSLRNASIQYAVKDLTASSVTNITGKVLMRQFYPVSLRSALIQYAVSET